MNEKIKKANSIMGLIVVSCSVRMTESNWLFLRIYHIVVVYVTDVDAAPYRRPS
jgi:hypothetical protein